MQIRVSHTIEGLAGDLAKVPANFTRQARGAVRKNARDGNTLARKLARQKSGPHGINYFKRLSSEMTGPLSAEYGPEGYPKTDFVGAGWRHGINTDLPNSADVIGPKFAKDVGDIADGLFW